MNDAATLAIRTPRLLLREIRYDDGPILFRYSAAPEHRRYDPAPVETEHDFESITRWMITAQDAYPRHYYYAAVCHQSDPDNPLGSVHITIQDHQHKQAEVGYMLGVPYWGQGYATEAARAMVHFAFKGLAMQRVYAADIILENAASARVAQRLGMRREAHFRHTHYFQGRWWDTLLYAILRDEWPS